MSAFTIPTACREPPHTPPVRRIVRLVRTGGGLEDMVTHAAADCETAKGADCACGWRSRICADGQRWQDRQRW